MEFWAKDPFFSLIRAASSSLSDEHIIITFKKKTNNNSLLQQFDLSRKLLQIRNVKIDERVMISHRLYQQHEYC